MTSYDHGVPSWLDIGVADFDTAAAFYSGLFGWEIPEGDEATGGYRSVTLGGQGGGGHEPHADDARAAVLDHLRERGQRR
jgi:predicted enzyme related to lactoylglutathione lyase